ncbi:hypothetical protein AC579_10570 [Pseudocercospora musae]|uniref:Uncharacterized protein n=1 Tax=Pseudocercospora musae TaxID=113226 RepID=A0A139GZN1_9PEZI|nr:hypothetical protein AC579_10570 [Pseudocercospora musae]
MIFPSITVTRLGPENRHPEQLSFTGKSEHQIQLPLRPDVNKLKKTCVDMHGSACDVYDMGDQDLGFESKLFYIGDNGRVVLGSGAPNGEMGILKRSPLTAPIR